MRLKSIPNIAENDIYLGTTSTYNVISNEVIDIVNTSENDENNTVPAFTRDIVTVPDINGKLDVTIETPDNIIITKEESYDIKTSYRQRLWYKYVCNRTAYFSNYLPQSITKTFSSSDSIKFTKLRSNNNEIILSNTYELFYHNGSDWIVINKDKYFVDLTLGEVNLLEYDIGYGLRFKFSYDKVYINIEYDRPQDEYQFHLTYINDFVVSNITYKQCIFMIMTVDRSVNTITYPSLTSFNGNLEEITEEVTPNILFNRVRRFDLDNINSNYIYAVTENNIYVKDINTDISYYIKHQDAISSIVSLSKPKNRTIIEPWFMNVTRSSFIGSNGKTYAIKEGDTNPSLMKRGIEKASIVNANTIVLRNQPVTFTDRYGKWKDIIVKKGTTELTITDVIIDKNQVIVEEDIRLLDIIEVEYVFRKTYTEIETYNVNPSIQYSSNNLSYNNYLLFYIIPEEQLINSSSRSVFAIYLDKYDDTGKSISYSVNDVIALGDNISVKNKMYLEAQEYVTVSQLELEPYLLGLVTIRDYYSPDVSKIYDGRRRGGGVSREVERIVLQNLKNELYHMYDIAKWDGEVIDLAGYIIVRIPSGVLNIITQQLTLYDTDVIMKPMSDRETYALTKAKSLISDICNKAKSYGKVIIIEYV